MIHVGYTPSFLRLWKKLPLDLRTEAKEKIDLFRENPDHPFLKTHKLSGKLSGRMSFSVNYSVRIVFRFEKENAVFLAIGSHDIYR